MDMPLKPNVMEDIARDVRGLGFLLDGVWYSCFLSNLYPRLLHSGNSTPLMTV